MAATRTVLLKTGIVPDIGDDLADRHRRAASSARSLCAGRARARRRAFLFERPERVLASTPRPRLALQPAE